MVTLCIGTATASLTVLVSILVQLSPGRSETLGQEFESLLRSW